MSQITIPFFTDSQAPTRRSSRPPVLRLLLGDEVVADNFAGGGGASSGLKIALGRSPDVAINHDPEAIAVHAANHPDTEHHLTDVFEVDPIKACRGKRVALAWFSPDCKHHSKAKGGKPKDAKIRGLAWVAVRWAAKVQPRVIVLENVEEFVDWGPLYRDHSSDCTGTGEACRKGCHYLRPIPERKGETFRAFCAKLRRLGYVVEWRLLRGRDYGAATIRRRLFLIARCDGRPIAWPAPTHGPGHPQPFREFATCVDWTDLGASIFDRERPLADATMRRIARGVREFVIKPGRRYFVPRADVMAVPYLIHRSNGERPGQAPRIYDIQRPLGTIVAQGQKHQLCVAFLARHYGDRPTGGWVGGASLAAPLPTITTRDHHALVTAFLVRYNGTGDAEPVTRPLGTLTTRDRYGLVTVEIDGDRWTIVDIKSRMLKPRELFRAQGFPEDYQIDPVGPNGKRLSKTAQVRMVGNSVCPPIAAAIARAALELEPMEVAA